MTNDGYGCVICQHALDACTCGVDHRAAGQIAPAEIPDLRLKLMQCWAPGGPFFEAARVGTESGLFSRSGLAYPGIGPWEGFVDWEYRALRSATLWHVAPPMVDLMVHAGDSLPDDVTLADVRPPAHAGLVVLGKPWLGYDAISGDRRVLVDLLLWAPVRVPPTPSHQRRSGFAVSTYTHVSEADTWGPMGRSDWPTGDRVADRLELGEQYSHIQVTEEQHRSFVEDRKMLAALWSLLDMKITVADEVGVARQVRRRTQRTLGPGVIPTVRVVRLREVRHEGESIEGLRGSRNYTHRWWVNPFWRWQHHGPKNSLRKLILVEGHVRGPTDLPLVLKEEVRTWMR